MVVRCIRLMKLRLSTPGHRAVFSWGAVAAGTVTALAIQVLLAMLGTGIGASTIDAVAGGETPSATVLGGGAAV